MSPSTYLVSINWRCVWRLMRGGSETVTLPDGTSVHFRWAKDGLSYASVTRSGEGCFVEIIPSSGASEVQS